MSSRARAIALLLRVFALLPYPATQALGWAVGHLLAMVPNTLRDTSRTNIARCLPELGATAQARLLRRSLVETGKTMLEAGAVWHWEGGRALALVRKVYGEQHVRDALAAGRGVILATPHLGQWELMGLYCSAHYPITTLYRPPRQTELDGVIRRARERLGAHLVPAGTAGVRALYRAIGRGEAVGLLPDQMPKGGEGRLAPFFAQPAHTMVLLSRLAMKTRAPVVFCYARRLTGGRGFQVHFLPAPAVLNEGTLAASLAGVNEMVERCVRTCPEQYQWGYKRFGSAPAP
ncbi:MAG TPA: lipid A biosynthesis acyltransferase [Gammaproteobacteria bacterium]|nr:lipid A biosynthesis acyltransferase [Gammaproteobacteria bacterium]